MTKGLRHWQHCLLSSCLDNINDPLPISLYSSSPDPSSLLVHSHRPLSQVTSTTMETAKHNNPTPKPHIPIYSLRVRAISPQTLSHSVSSLGVHTLACFFILPLGLENGHRCVSLLYPVQITLCVGQGKGNPQITSMFTVTEKRMGTSSSGIILIILEFLCVFWVFFFLSEQKWRWGVGAVCLVHDGTWCIAESWPYHIFTDCIQLCLKRAARQKASPCIKKIQAICICLSLHFSITMEKWRVILIFLSFRTYILFPKCMLPFNWTAERIYYVFLWYRFHVFVHSRLSRTTLKCLTPPSSSLFDGGYCSHPHTLNSLLFTPWY